jgi:mannose/fructose/N-acetylgalactosamine-specific phosphotransferase system component IID
LVSAYNIGSLVYDVWDYVSNITSAIADFASDLASGGDDDEDSGLLFLIIITAIALVIGFIITYAAYRAGRESV